MNSRRLGRIRYTDRWFCYFDLLGFSNLVATEHIDDVVRVYEEVLGEIEEKVKPKAHRGVSCSWFSDSFILFTRGGTEEEFALIEQAGRLFFQKLLASRIPVRGALSYGKLYSQLERNVFIGPALIDAYRYCEDQNWLGFILAPSVYNRCRGTVLDLDRRLHYRRVDTPGIFRKLVEVANVYAFAFNNGRVNGHNPYLQHIRAMRVQAGQAHEQKYLNTEAFLMRHDHWNEGSAD